MCYEILTTGDFCTYREKDHNLLMSIRNGDYMDSNGQMNNEFFEMVNHLDTLINDAFKTSSLPDNVDMEKIEDFLYSINLRIANDEI